jgi:hypothetical protein
VVQHAAWSAYHGLDTFFELLDLLGDGSASVDRCDFEALVATDGFKLARDLERQLACGAEGDELNPSLASELSIYHGDGEGSCLSGTRPGLDHQVSTLEDRVERGGLHLRRSLEFHIDEGLTDLRCQLEIIE